jgi:hypothetical protein
MFDFFSRNPANSGMDFGGGASPGLLGGGGMDPRMMGLLNAGASMLQASGPSTTPKSFGQIAGSGLMGGLQGFGMGKQFEAMDQRSALHKAQMDELARKTKAGEEQAARVAAFGASLPEAERTAFMANPTAYLEALYKQDKGPLVVPAGGSVVDRKDPTKPLFSAPFKPEAPKPSSLAQLIAERSALPPDSPHARTYDEAIRKATTHQPPIATLDLRQDNKFNERVGTEMGEQYANLLKADMSAPASIAKYERLGQLLGNVNTGKFRGTITDMKAAAKAVGFDLTAMGIADDVAPAQAARALSNQIALELRNPAGGAGMPGALSDKDREFLTQSIPGLENDPAAIGKMVEYRVKLEQRAQKVARMAREYRKKNGGRFDDGFYDELQEWSDRNPLFPEVKQSPKPTGGLTTEEQAELEQLRQRFKR